MSQARVTRALNIIQHRSHPMFFWAQSPARDIYVQRLEEEVKKGEEVVKKWEDYIEDPEREATKGGGGARLPSYVAKQPYFREVFQEETLKFNPFFKKIKDNGEAKRTEIQAIQSIKPPSSSSNNNNNDSNNDNNDNNDHDEKDLTHQIQSRQKQLRRPLSSIWSAYAQYWGHPLFLYQIMNARLTSRNISMFKSRGFILRHSLLERFRLHLGAQYYMEDAEELRTPAKVKMATEKETERMDFLVRNLDRLTVDFILAEYPSIKDDIVQELEEFDYMLDVEDDLKRIGPKELREEHPDH